MKLIRGLELLAVVGALAFLTGCGPTVASPAMGILYTDVTWGGDAEAGGGFKQGKSCAQAFLGMVATGDASVEAAKRAGGIKEVASVDHYSHSILGIVGEFCTIVTGQ